MNVKEFEKKEKSTASLTVEVTPEEFEAAVQKIYMKVRGRLNIPGFRKGKAPRKIIENIYGTGVFYEDAIDELAPTALDVAVKEKELSTVGRPTVSDVKVGEDKSLTLTFTVALYPEITVSDYKGIAAPKMPVEVAEADVERELKKAQEQNARVETVDRAAQNGDIATIDYEGFVDGVPFEGGKAEGTDLELGSGTFIPGYEEQVVGHSAGEAFDVNVTFPQNYAPELAGKDATFKVVLQAVKEKLLPALDDEFAKDVSEFDTLEAYKASVKKELEEKRAEESQKAFEEVVLSRLVEKVEGDIPDAMIDEHLDQMIDNFRFNLKSQGMELEQYAGMFGMDLDMFKQQFRPNAEKEVKSDLAFEYIAKTEQFDVTAESVEAEYQRLAETYEMTLDAVKKAVPEGTVKTGLQFEAARNLVLSSAVVEEKAE